MWKKSENSEDIRPLEIETAGEYVIVRKNFIFIEEATEEKPAHYEYDEWQMSREQYEVYSSMSQEMADQSDALVELAELIAEVIDNG